MFILFLVLSPPLVLPVKTSNIFRLLNEVCIQTTFRNESETTAVVEYGYSKLTDMHFNGFIASSACVHKTIEHAEDIGKLLL